jgi:hypothetical protein
VYTNRTAITSRKLERIRTVIKLIADAHQSGLHLTTAEQLQQQRVVGENVGEVGR